MLPDWVSNPGPLTYESGALQTALPCQIRTINNFSFSKAVLWKGQNQSLYEKLTITMLGKYMYAVPFH